MRPVFSFAVFLAASQMLLCGAMAQTKSVAGKPHKSADTSIKQVLSEYDAGRFEQAMQLCRKVLSADPKNLTAHYVMGNICVKTNRIKDATAQYQYCLQSPAAATSPEAAYARKALEQIEQQNQAQLSEPPASRGGGSGYGPMVGSTKGAEEYIQEQTDILMKEYKEKLAVKQHTLDTKVAQIQDEIKQQTLNLPRIGSRRYAQQEARQEAQDDIKQDGQRRIDQLKKDFQREADDLNQAVQSRISGLTDHYHNVESQTGNRSVGR